MGQDPRPVAVLEDSRYREHRAPAGHPECPERLTVILNALREASLLDQLVPIPFRQAKAEEIALVHEPAYVDLVRLMCDDGFTR